MIALREILNNSIQYKRTSKNLVNSIITKNYPAELALVMLSPAGPNVKRTGMP